jgi:hypothetical protein
MAFSNMFLLSCLAYIKVPPLPEDFYQRKDHSPVRITMIKPLFYEAITLLVIISLIQGHQLVGPKEGILERNLYGCDALVDSCGKNGKCCDWHDECYNANDCTQESWLGQGMIVLQPLSVSIF